MKGMRMYYEVNGEVVGAKNIAESNGVANKNELIYPSVYGEGIDLRLQQQTTKRKMDYIIQSREALSNVPNGATYLVFEEMVELPSGARAELRDNEIAVLNANGELIVVYERPIINEPNKKKVCSHEHASGKKCKELHALDINKFNEGSYGIDLNGNNLIIKTRVDVSWLMLETRTFPIEIDPSADFSPNNAAWWTGELGITGPSFASNTIYDSWSNSLYMGLRSSSVFHSWIKFNTSSIVDHSSVSSAELNFYINGRNITASSCLATVRFGQISNDPVSATNANRLSDIKSGNTYLTHDFVQGTTSTGWKSYTLGGGVTSDLEDKLVDDWFAIGLQTTNTDHSDELHLRTHSSSDKPYLSVDYIEVRDYAVEWVSMDIGDNFWCKEIEEEREISVTLKNIGDKTWNSEYTTNIGVRWSTDGSTTSPWSDYHVRVSAGSLAPGATNTFTMNLRPKNASAGPSYTTDLDNGMYYLVFDVVNEGQCWFGTNGGVCGPGNSRYVSSAITLTDDCIEFCADGTYELTSPHTTDNILWYDDEDPCAEVIGEGNPFGVSLSGSTIFYTDGFNNDELTTGSITGNALSGNFAEVGQMFDIEAPSDKDLIVTGITIVKRAADQQIKVYYRPESYINYWEGQDQGGWNKIVDEWSASGASSTFHFGSPVIIPAGCKYGFYTHADVNYTTDLTTRSNSEIILHSGHGGVWSTTPFVMQNQRSFSGEIFYESRPKTDRVPVVARKIDPPTAPDAIAGTTPLCPDEEVTLTASGGTTSGDNVEVWFDKACNDAFVEDWATLGYTPVSTTVNSVQRGILNVTSTTIDPMIPMYGIGSWDPNVYKYIQIRYRVTSGTAGNTEIFFTNSVSATAIGGQMVSAPMVSDGEWHILNIDMSTHGSWTHSNITGWRYDYATVSGATIELDFIALSANKIIGVGNELNVSPSETTTYYVQRRGLCGETTCYSKEIVVNQPSINATLTAGDAVWNGADDTDFNDVNNWYIYDGNVFEFAESLPDGTTNVVVPAPGVCIEHNPNIAAATRSVRDITIENGATLTIGTGTLNVSGDFTNNGTLTPGTGTVNFNGTTLQKLGGTTATAFYNLTLNNSGAGDHQLELDQDISVTNNLTLTNGVLKLNEHHIDLGATGDLVGENNDNYVFCECPSAYIRATGDINTAGVAHNLGSLGLEITPSAGNGLGDVEIIRRHQRVIAADGLEESISRIYEVTKNGGGSVDNNGSLDADIALSYLTHELNGMDPSDLSLYRQPIIGVDSWYEYGGSVDVGSQKIIYEGWNEFSGLTGGEFVSPLPVTYLGMQGTCDEAGNILFWQTASEQNSYYFDVERSIDGYTWEKVGRVQAAGNTSSESNYEFIDEEATANFEGYYRLKQVDLDGTFVYLPPISVFCNTSTELRLEIYPNPTTGVTNAYVFYDGKSAVDGALTITDAVGKLVYKREITLQNGGNNFVMNLSDHQQGVYTVTIRTKSGKVLHGKVVKH